ncbi:MAG: hypothetical protein HY673_06395 [Chloroflexi bacterium]|nr:hypothetical protein [Chloroflexota bacterium]
MKRLYLPLVLAVVLAELGLLVWLLAAIIPLHAGETYLQEDAAYRPYISGQDAGSPAVVITQWLFFLMTAGTLIPVGLIIAGELVRWGLGQRKRGRSLTG